MKKLLLIFALLPLFASAQITPAQDTTLITGSAPFTPQNRYTNVTLSGVNYRIPQFYNSILGKYDTYITSKYLRAFYAPLSGLSGYVPNTRLVSTGYGITGGGNLGSNLTLVVDTANIVTKTYAGRYALQSGLGTYLLKADSVNIANNYVTYGKYNYGLDTLYNKNFSNKSSIISPHVTSFLAPNAANAVWGNGTFITVGYANSPLNSGTLQFVKTAAGSSNNFMTLGLYLTPGPLNVYHTSLQLPYGTVNQLLALDSDKHIVNVTAIPSTTTATTQSPLTSNTTISTTKYTDDAVAVLKGTSPQTVASFSQTGKTNVGSLISYTPPVDGYYNLDGVIYVSSITTNTIRIRYEWTNVSGQTVSAVSATVSSAVPANNNGTTIVARIYAKGGVPINITTENVVSVGTQTYDVALALVKPF